VTARALAHFGFEVIGASDGVAGLELFRENSGRLACVLLDMTMPRMGGEEAFLEMHSADPSVPVVLMSGFSEQDAAARLAGEGLAGFLQKPYELTSLRDTVRAVVEGLHAPQESRPSVGAGG
jgi:DNA-binding NtrC family response regulator